MRPKLAMRTPLVLRLRSHCSQTNAAPLNAARPPPQTSQERLARDCSLINLDPRLEIATQTPSLVRHTPFLPRIRGCQDGDTEGTAILLLRLMDTFIF